MRTMESTARPRHFLRVASFVAAAFAVTVAGGFVAPAAAQQTIDLINEERSGMLADGEHSVTLPTGDTVTVWTILGYQYQVRVLLFQTALPGSVYYPLAIVLICDPASGLHGLDADAGASTTAAPVAATVSEHRCVLAEQTVGQPFFFVAGTGSHDLETPAGGVQESNYIFPVGFAGLPILVGNGTVESGDHRVGWDVAYRPLFSTSREATLEVDDAVVRVFVTGPNLALPGVPPVVPDPFLGQVCVQVIEPPDTDQTICRPAIPLP